MQPTDMGVEQRKGYFKKQGPRELGVADTLHQQRGKAIPTRVHVSKELGRFITKLGYPKAIPSGKLT